MGAGNAHPKRGDIWFCDLSPTRDHEQAGARPVFVLAQPDKTLSIVLPISQGITLARSQGFAVSLTGTGLLTQGGDYLQSAAYCLVKRDKRKENRGVSELHHR